MIEVDQLANLPILEDIYDLDTFELQELIENIQKDLQKIK